MYVFLLQLDLSYCPKVKDVTALGNVEIRCVRPKTEDLRGALNGLICFLVFDNIKVFVMYIIYVFLFP